MDSPERKGFNAVLNAMPEGVREEYYSLKLAFHSKKLIEHGHPVLTTVSDLYSLLIQANTNVDSRKYGIKDVEKWHKDNDSRNVYRGGDD